MKRKTLLTILFVMLVSLMMAIPAMAASDSGVGVPDEVLVVNGRQFFFANGATIVVKDRTDADGCVVTWNDGANSVTLDANCAIFGGMHADSTPVTTNVTVEGGEMYLVVGAGLHESTTTTSNLTIKGGTITSACGGGITTVINSCSCGTSNWEPATYTQADYKLSNNQTGTANVTLAGGSVYLLYGGGGSGNTNTDTVNLKITGGTHDWVTGGSSNGNTTTVNTVISGGTVTDYQNVNRGTATEATTEVTGGTVIKLSVVSNSANVVSLGDASVTIGADATVTELTYGYNNGVVVDTTGNINAEDIKVAASANVGNMSSVGSNVTLTYTVSIDGTEYSVVAGQTVTSIPGYDTLTTKDGYIFKGLKNGDADYDVTAAVNSNLVLTTVFEQIKYKVTVKDSTNGKVVANVTEAAKGDSVELTITAAEGYELDTLTVNGTESEAKFTMPAEDVTVEATFKVKKVEDNTVNNTVANTANNVANNAVANTANNVANNAVGEKDDTPKTGVKSIVLFVAVIAIVGLVVIKKEEYKK